MSVLLLDIFPYVSKGELYTVQYNQLSIIFFYCHRGTLLSTVNVYNL